MPLRKPRPRRLSRTAVEDAVHQTKTRDSIEKIHPTETLPSGRKRVETDLADLFTDPRAESPAVAQLIGALEAGGWHVSHQKGVFNSRLIITEPAPEED